MSYSVESVINFLIAQNNNNINISFPAVIVSTERLVDNLVDVQPIVNFKNPMSLEYLEYPVIKDVSLVFPSNKTSSICFPIAQGDFVDLVFQSSDIQDFMFGNTDTHDPTYNSFGNLTNVVAFVGFTPYQESCFNPNNYSTDFNNQDLNIVHNKNTPNESSISINTDGEITLRSPTVVKVEAKEVQVLSDTINANDATINTQGDVVIQGQSVNQFMKTHTHIGNKGAPTSTPQP